MIKYYDQVLWSSTMNNYYDQALPLEWNLQKVHRFILLDVVHIQIPIKGAGLL